MREILKMEVEGPEMVIAEYLSARGVVAVEIRAIDDGYLVRIPNPEDFLENELSQVAGQPVKLEKLPYGMD